MLRRLFCDDRTMMIVIVLNTLAIFVSGFFPHNFWVINLDFGFTLFFIAEAVVKIRTYGWKGYWKKGWNRFDFIILLLALPSLADPFMHQALEYNVLLSLRTLRIFKSFRIFRFIPNAEQLFNGMKMALKSSFLVCVAFMTLLLIFGIMTSALFGSAAPEYFGNPGISIYNTFRLFTVEGWYEMPDAIAANSSVEFGIFARFYFSILLFCGGILGMSLINSIFVDSMAADNNDEIMEKLKKISKQLEEMKKEADKKQK